MQVRFLRKLVLLLLFLLIIEGMVTGCNRPRSATDPERKHLEEINQATPKKSIQPSETGKVLVKDQTKAAQKSPEETSITHPYGKAASGILLWETDPEFRAAQARYKTPIRMGAFQTTLPDPLAGEEQNVAIGADKLAGMVLEPGESFSMNTRIGPYTLDQGYKKGPTYAGTKVLQTVGGGVCKISTTLYNSAVLANLKIRERYPHSMLVPYVPAGQDATVGYGYKDFRFLNNTDHRLLIWADTEDNTLYVAIYGNTVPPKVTWHHEITKRTPIETIYRYNPKLSAKEERVLLPGAEGVTVKSWVTIDYDDGTQETKQRGTDNYKAMPRIIERGKQE